ncbi:hypothetical protein HNY73_018811 [Argiope bruennichi]|uniref:Uncharacterized protein n=1 Tax=Argiope bruennichi TaxID=94029 RepID=A0A8T0EHI9_ARGBR|nr:hypothetical protein HNY73_018811 [Argiope bruennichi]
MEKEFTGERLSPEKPLLIHLEKSKQVMENSIETNEKDLVSNLSVKAIDTATDVQTPASTDQQFFTCDVCDISD